MGRPQRECDGSRRVAVTTLGCRSNQYDSSAIEDLLSEAGFEVAEFPAVADAYIINTCTVTGRTDAQSRRLARRARRLNPEAVVIVTGCYAQVSPAEVARIDGVDYVLGNAEKARLAEYVSRGRPEAAGTVVRGAGPGEGIGPRARSSSGRTRANLKVQDGCDRACSYCIIPRARGRSRSLGAREIEREIDSLVELGYREIVLTGIHLGAWGADLGEETGLCALVRRLEEKDYPCRFRLSSIDPDEVSPALVELLSSARSVCNHVHLPLQSGDDAVLRRMNRPYTAAAFAARVEGLVRAVPGIAVGVDVMAGFPGEGQTEFDNTLSLLASLPVAYMHVFPFSPRPGTRAGSMDGRVPDAAIKERCARLRELDALKRREFRAGFVGTTASVLIEPGHAGHAGRIRGRTTNYIRVEAGGVSADAGFVEVVLRGLTETGMTGEQVSHGAGRGAHPRARASL